MKYVKIEWNDEWRGYWLDPRPYLDVLAEDGLRLPPGASEFARDPGHYDFGSATCVKDLTLRAVTWPAGGEDRAEIDFGPNDSKHESDLRIVYTGVTSVSVEPDAPDSEEPDWPDAVLLDEILPQESGCTHEIELTHSRIVVTCADLHAEWTPRPAT